MNQRDPSRGAKHMKRFLVIRLILLLISPLTAPQAQAQTEPLCRSKQVIELKSDCAVRPQTQPTTRI
jgi:hypothetical protein